MSTDPDQPEQVQPAPLFVANISRVEDVDDALIVEFSRGVTDDEVEHMRRLPPSTVVARDAQHFAERVLLSELACRLFRTLVLGNIIIAESPAAMDWLRDWIDGTLEGHGPMGSGPMIWPEKLTQVATILRQWGFQPTPTVPPYVMRQPGLQLPKGAVLVEQGEPS
jgi:hypothetical protein